MRAVESQWWIIELPEEWEAAQDEDVIVISDEDDVGEIVITTLQKDTGVVEPEELASFTEDTSAEFGGGMPVQVGELSGQYFNYQEDDDAVREWYLYSGNLLIFITYCCDIENSGMDDGIVDEIIGTIFIKQQESTDPQ